MQINRRVEKLEAALPEHAPSYRVIFRQAGDPVLPVHPPLRPNERELRVVFGRE